MNLLENLVINFFWICSLKKVHIICCIFALILYLRKSFSCDMGQNALGQSDCMIFKLTISPEQKDKKAWFLACWCKFLEIKSRLKNIGMGLVKYGCGHSGLRTLKLAVSQEGMNLFLVCWWKFRKAKSYFNNFWMVLVKNGRGLLGLVTLKSSLSQEWIN